MQNDHVRKRLLDRRQELNRRTRRLEADLRRDAAPLGGSFAEQASEQGNDAVLEAIGLSADDELKQIDIALERITAGSYGHCAACGAEILPARLQVVPYTQWCRDCAPA